MHASSRARRTSSRLAACAGALGLIAATPVLAAINEIDVDYNDVYHQTGAAAPTYAGSFFSARLQMANPGEYASATVTYGPDPTTQTLGPLSSDTLIYQTFLYGNQAALLGDFPAGDYQFSANSDVASLTVSDMPFAPAPMFENLTALSSVDPTHAFHVMLNGFSQDPLASDAFSFLTIYDYTTNAFVYDAGFYTPSTTDFVIDANTLVAGHNYGAEAIYSSRIGGYDILDQAYTNQLFDSRTDALFSVGTGAVPEPASWALIITGFGALGVAMRRRRALVTA